jgi:hypothetical protein
MSMTHTRRRFLTKAAMALGAPLIAGSPARADERLETTTLRFIKSSSICAAQYIAERLLRTEGLPIAASSTERASRSSARSPTILPIFDMHYGPRRSITTLRLRAQDGA